MITRFISLPYAGKGDLRSGDTPAEINGSLKELRKTVGTLRYCFAYPEIEKSLRVKEIGQEEMLRTLRADADRCVDCERTEGFLCDSVAW